VSGPGGACAGLVGVAVPLSGSMSSSTPNASLSKKRKAGHVPSLVIACGGSSSCAWNYRCDAACSIIFFRPKGHLP
jgi:hypothetical protein